jgi:hypothetical protein
MLRTLLRFVLRLAGAVAVTAVAGFLADRYGAGDGQVATVGFTMIGSLLLFFAESLDSVIWYSHGLRAEASPPVVYRILGVVFCTFGVLCLLFWRD